MARRFLVDVDLKRSLLADGSAGTSGYVLKSQGVNQPPVWAAESGGGGGSGSYTVSSNPPTSPVQGDRWYDIDLGIEFTYVNDGNSSQWVETSTGGGASSSPIVETQQVISQDIELSIGANGLSVGPVEVADTYAVTVPENAAWAIV